MKRMSFVAACSLLIAAGSPGRAGEDLEPGIYALPDISLGDFQDGLLPGTLTDDRGFRLGSIGSSLYHDPADPVDVFWMITDRGPNGDYTATIGTNPDGTPITEGRKTFPLPAFNPAILQVRAEGGVLSVLQAMPITTTAGGPVTGIPNIVKYDDPGYDLSGEVMLPFIPTGLDTEGLVRTRKGDFWACEEYSPSILHIAADGTVLGRHVPAGLKLDPATVGYPVAFTLPKILLKRKVNRGFEGIALSNDQRTLYVTIQSPLSNPTSKIGNASRMNRIFAFDLVREKVTAEYVYVLQPSTEFAGETKASEMKVSDLKVVGGNSLLVDERTDKVAKLYLARFDRATNILGTKWDDTATDPSLEALTPDKLSAQKIVPMSKTLYVDLSTIPGMPGKIEGVALLGKPFVVAVANDNDFGIGSFDAEGNLIDTGVKSQLVVFDGSPRNGGGGSIVEEGDIDGDGDLDSSDFRLFLGSYGKVFGEPGWIEAADLDRDLAVTILDYQLWYALYRAAQ